MNEIIILNKYQIWQKKYGAKVLHLVCLPIYLITFIYFSLWFNNFEEYITLGKAFKLLGIMIVSGGIFFGLSRMVLIRSDT